DYLQEGIGLRAMAQRDPLVEYQREGFQLFQAMTEAIKEESVGYLFNVDVTVAADEEEAESDGAPILVAKGLVGTQRSQQLQYSAPTAEGDVEVHGEGGRPMAGGRNQAQEGGGGNRAQRRAQRKKGGRR